MSLINNVLSKFGYIKNSCCDAQFDQVPSCRSGVSTCFSPLVQEQLIAFSVNEYKVNPYYKLLIENLANHTIGTSTNIIGTSQIVSEKHNDMVEDAYMGWVSNNRIGTTYRNIRKQAALTGLGIGIPFRDDYSQGPVQLSYKVLGANRFETPVGARPEDRIINGIQYDRNWEILAFHVSDNDNRCGVPNVNDTKEYRVEEVIYWERERQDGVAVPLPECASAFTYYPYIRRYLQAVIESEEFNASFPMAVELDPKVYSSYSASVREQTPTGSFEYEPKMVPTLAPGMKLTGIPQSARAADRETISKMFAAACALSVSMPRNLALGDSSDSNMASAQVDIQPWANKVKIDRFDMEPMFRRSFNQWWSLASRREMDDTIRAAHLTTFPHVYVYPDLFEHPDPAKRANARAVDLASGSGMLNRQYSNNGMNFRRELEREAKALRIPVEQLIDTVLTSRSADAIDLIQPETSPQE